MPLNQSRHDPLTSIATSALDSRPDLTTPYNDDSSGQFTPGFQNGNAGPPGTPGAGPLQSPSSPYSPGMRSNLAKQQSNEANPFDKVQPGEIQMQNFEEGAPPAPKVSFSWEKIDRWAEENYTELWDQLSEGATQNDVNELEHELDCTLPAEVRDSLQVHDGQERGGRPTGIIFGCMLLDCEEIVQEWKNWKVVNEEYLTNPATQRTSQPPKAFAGSSSSAPVSHQATNPLWRQELIDKQDSQPPRAIQKAYAHPSWIPLARDWGGNNLAVDLAPGPTGKWGQVIIFGRDFDCKYVVSRSWAAFLATVSDDLRSEKVFVEEETGELKLREFKTQRVEPPYLQILRWRADQKYGRKGPRRKPGPGPGPGGNMHGHTGRTGSPYGSPTEERGRSPQRFPPHGPPGATSSPRGSGIGRPSRLAIVSENVEPKIQTGADANKDAFAKNAGTNDREANLMELNTPTVGPDDAKKDDLFTKAIDSGTQETVLKDVANGKTKSDLTGLGVDGLDEMKSVEI